MKYLQLNDIDCYKRSLQLSNYVWEIIIKWDYFAKETVGTQFTRAVDSISANIAEGFGRYSFGSLKEACDWTQKSYLRNLISKEQYDHILAELQALPKEVNQLIQFTNERLKQ